MAVAQQDRPVRRSYPGRFRRRRSGRTAFIVIVVGLLVYFVLGPLALLVFSSFRGTDGVLPFEEGAYWTLSNFEHVFLSGETYRLLGNTLLFGGGALVVCFTISIALAWLVERTDLPLGRIIAVLVIAQLGIPGFIETISWTFLLNPGTGYVNALLRLFPGVDGPGPLNVFTLPGMIFVQAIGLVPITFLLVAAGFRAMNVALEDAGRMSGAAPLTVVRKVTIPVLMPGLLSAAVYLFVSVVESFETPFVIGLRADIHVLSTAIYYDVKSPSGLPNYGIASGYSVLVIVLVLIPLLYYNHIISKARRYAVVTGKSYHANRYRLGRAKPYVLAGVGLFLLVAFVLPVGALIWTSVQPFVAAPTLEAFSRISFDTYGKLLSNDIVLDAAKNTLYLGVIAAVATMLLSFCTAWIIVRTKSVGSRVVDLLAFMPHAFPGVIIGVSILLLYLYIPNPIYGTIWIIALAVSTQYLSLGTRLMGGNLTQIDIELESAATMSGATWSQTLRRIVAPLALPALFNGALLVFLSAIKNLTLPLMLYSDDSTVLSTLVWLQWFNGLVPEAATIGVVMVAITVAISFMLRGGPEIGGWSK
ncbi:ABC transporter permease [Actinophytocola sp.]|uniref:ABC transporter permease n=1 Tax=Actinophytocola sp. TaxID=1872138 RepID=UPI003D6A4ECA